MVLAIAWSPVAISVYWPGAWLDNWPNAETFALVLVYLGFVCGLPRWGKAIHGWQQPFARCGLIFQRQTLRDGAIALLIGLLGVFALFGIETLLGWAVPTAPSPKLLRFIVEGALVGLAVGFAEELLFRGWVLAELEQTYRATTALVMNALFFAGTHFIRPLDTIIATLPQFFGLFVLGLALVWARRSPTGTNAKAPARTRLGYPIGLHGGLVWGYYIVDLGRLSDYTGRAPEWVTGIDSNPLAGLMGIILLGLIGRQFAKQAKGKTESL